MFRTLLAAFCVTVFSFSSASAQSTEGISLDANGQLVGKALVTGEETPVEAKVTIAKDGVVLDTVQAKEDGSFSFANLEPGTYNMYGSAANFVGAQTVDVLPYSGGGCSSCSLGMNSYSSASYDTYASAPVSACSSCSPCGGCGGRGGLFGGRLLGGGGFGGGLGGGGGLLGGGGGGLFSSRLFRLGAIGGVVAIATSSPDN